MPAVLRHQIGIPGHKTVIRPIKVVGRRRVIVLPVAEFDSGCVQWIDNQAVPRQIRVSKCGMIFMAEADQEFHQVERAVLSFGVSAPGRYFLRGRGACPGHIHAERIHVVALIFPVIILVLAAHQKAGPLQGLEVQVALRAFHFVGGPALGTRYGIRK